MREYAEDSPVIPSVFRLLGGRERRWARARWSEGKGGENRRFRAGKKILEKSCWRGREKA